MLQEDCEKIFELVNSQDFIKSFGIKLVSIERNLEQNSVTFKFDKNKLGKTLLIVKFTFEEPTVIKTRIDDFEFVGKTVDLLQMFVLN